ncbi:MAG: UDP-N-acetylmuramoyl-L-alanine--D-glutamate ligase [Coriobacteriales bacterium]|jgi:UDP-N-acetylmuramoylalanine--D-glutamate ligase|nr:UDP-N-acetylmuramoyl-L-alanine--D-glutamate ligase [Coriobacteriales bacterium]
MTFDELRSVGSVCVLGLGVTGEAVCRLFAAWPPEHLTVYTGKALSSSMNPLTDVNLPADTHIIERPEDLRGPFDLCVVSPGIPQTGELYQRARRISGELISEPELAWRLSSDHWIVVTGTNGKTTTTTLSAYLLNRAGIPARVAGNIGIPCVDAVQQRAEGEYIVAELSSFQLASAPLLAPEAAILLNITPDHLSWHGGEEAYARAKTSFIERMALSAPIALDATRPEIRVLSAVWRDAGRRVLPIGSSAGITERMVVHSGVPEAAWLDAASDRLTLSLDGVTISLSAASDLQIRGEHNTVNALAAALIVCALGASPALVGEGLTSFEPLEHRTEPVSVVAGVLYVNDSKATNPEATIKALAAFPDRPVVAMLGGRDKLTPLDELIAATRDTCRALVCYGEAGPRFSAAFDEAGLSSITHLVSSFDEAFATAANQAQTGDVVLLSPACSSYDEFDDYQQRGTCFKALVAARAGVADHDD